MLNKSAYREHHAEVLTAKLTTMLYIFTPRRSKFELSASIQRTLIHPAIHLAQQLQLSNDKYTFEWEFSFRPAERLQDTKEKMVRRGNGICQFDVCPTLRVERGGGYAVEVLMPAKVMVVSVAEEGRDGGAGVKTVLGWLEERVGRAREGSESHMGTPA